MEQTIRWSSHFKVHQAPDELDQGDKVILPSLVLEQLLAISHTLPSPLTFRLTHPHTGAHLHCGIDHYTSDTTIGLPSWMIQHLALTDHVLIQLEILPKGNWTRLKPIAHPHQAIQDYRAALEAHMRAHYHTLSQGQRVSCRYGGHVYQFEVIDLKPETAVSLTDTDLEVEIDPIDSVEVVSDHVWALDRLVSSLELSEPYWVTLDLPDLSHVVIQADLLEGDVDIVVGTESKPTLENHTWADLSSDQSKSLVLPVSGLKKLSIGLIPYQESVVGSFKVSRYLAEIESTNEPESNMGKVQCENCQQWVPDRTLILHEGFCKRNNVVCRSGCGRVFKKDSEEWREHWHCESCEFVGRSQEKEKHRVYFHQTKTCDCQEFSSPSYPELAAHKRKECKERLIFCRYCHILTAQGHPSSDPRDRLLGLHTHESYCGSRTIDCQKCSKPIPIKNIQVHAKIHEVKRQQQVLPPLCSNQTCTRPRVKNKLNFCQFCFGPFWITEDDPKNQKIIQRVVRTIHRQMTIGCGHDWCKNKYCASFTKDPKDPTTSATLLIPIIKNLSKELASPHPNLKVYICVDEATSRKRFLAELVYNETELYELEWCIKAIEMDQDIDRAKAWLDKNAPRKNHKF